MEVPGYVFLILITVAAAAMVVGYTLKLLPAVHTEKTVKSIDVELVSWSYRDGFLCLELYAYRPTKLVLLTVCGQAMDIDLIDGETLVYLPIDCRPLLLLEMTESGVRVVYRWPQ